MIELSPAAVWHNGKFELPSFAVEKGGVIAPFYLSYMVWGEPSASGDNVVLHCPTASGLKEAAKNHVGIGRLFDGATRAVIAVDAIGGGESVRPADQHGPLFPAYSIRDNARAIYRLLTEGLGLRRISAAGGASMGAMIALELAACFPDFVDSLYLWSPSSRCSAMFTGLVRLFEASLELDPCFKEGFYSTPPERGLGVAGQAYFMSLIGRRYLDTIEPRGAEDLSRSIGHLFASTWDANDLLSRYRSLLSYDLTAGRNGSLEQALEQMTIPCLLMPCPSDLLLPIEDAERLSRALPASTLVPIPSEMGHWSSSQPPGSAEHSLVTRITREFLENL